jgi:predicted NBD/HSP70 family sugar kinase
VARDEQLSAHGIRRGDRRLMAEMNRNLVFNVMRTGAISRADVVRTSGLSPGEKSSLSETLRSNRTIEVVRVAADEGDAMATDALQSAGEMLGLWISALVNLLNPRLVIPFWPRGPGRAARVGSRLWIGPRALFCRYRPKYGLFCRFGGRCCLD